MVHHRDNLITVHEDVEFFREAVLFTARNTGINTALVEKDYFCSLLLSYLYQQGETNVVFRGGTSLGKIYADFYRLSEDLDFVIPTSADATRQQRRRLIVPFKKLISEISGENSVFHLSQQLREHSNSAQYIGYLTYTSIADIPGQLVRIKIEVGLDEELLDSPVTKEARTLLIDPFRNAPAVAKINVKTLTLREAYAEKLRAALTRRDVAIRDFYDIDYALTNRILDLTDPILEQYVLNKLRVSFHDPIDISPSRRSTLQSQLETQLKPVLRPKDYEGFDLDGAFDLVAGFGTRIQRHI
jgi:predicted nucleotidyltransferase component of viral defense system